MAESRHKYLYERLGDQPFQQLVNALLVRNFPGYLPLPVRQADGGRDGVQRDGRDLLIYQVKWSATAREKDPVGWLSQAVAAEDANIRRLVADGAKKYVLVTNVASTGKARTGTFDRLEARLDEHAAAYGIDMSPMWRETVDAFVDSAPRTPSSGPTWTCLPATTSSGTSSTSRLLPGETEGSRTWSARPRRPSGTRTNESSSARSTWTGRRSPTCSST